MKTDTFKMTTWHNYYIKMLHLMINYYGKRSEKERETFMEAGFKILVR